ncbi:ABC transporter substrate-binding protein [Microvirga massiliensis]|uniref:ABC transporter substrate-binding protein n=1 Tax=Microvirga massiliensis TaxID=1033741 RepID=UPI00062BCF16|nr:ABC transporter substrate-binding protein [Microvirga massiliensis]
MRRREFIAVVAAIFPGARLLCPAHAQTSAIRRIGVVYQGGLYEASIEGLRAGLRAAGLEEGRHVALLLRNARGDLAPAEAAARALERDEKVDVIVAIGTSTALAAKRATTAVPIVFAAGADPVAAGLVESIATPGGRLTGFHFLTVDLTAKRLEILREIVPTLRRIVTFYDPRTPGAVLSIAALREAAGTLDIEVVAQQVTSPEELRGRLRTLSAAQAEAFFFVADFLVINHAPLVIEAANALRLPSMATQLGAVREGALAGYGPDWREYGRRPARYVARILAGSLPRDLPVEIINQPALAINLKTAKAIGFDIPPLLLARADEVIE